MAGGGAPAGGFSTTSNLTKRQTIFAFALVTSL
ncbi:hypothetical protein JCM10212_001147, partial [Sporobolomyces blumeae]